MKKRFLKAVALFMTFFFSLFVFSPTIQAKQERQKLEVLNPEGFN